MKNSDGVNRLRLIAKNLEIAKKERHGCAYLFDIDVHSAINLIPCNSNKKRIEIAASSFGVMPSEIRKALRIAS